MKACFRKLFSKIDDQRKGNRKVAMMSPVGDEKLIRNFTKMVKKQTFKDFDILFIYPKGSKFCYDKELSMIHVEEKLLLGTSGCFFAGQAFLYTEGYEIIIIADIDAIPSSNKMLEHLVERAKNEKCAVLPLSTPPDGGVNERVCNVNQYGTCHRSVFDTAGFATPYFWRGGEDWELMRRLLDKRLIKIAARSPR